MVEGCESCHLYAPIQENVLIVEADGVGSTLRTSVVAKKETNVSVQDGKEAVVLLKLLGNDVLTIVDKERE